MINKINLENYFKKEKEIAYKEKSDWVVGDFVKVKHDLEGQFIKGEIFKIIGINTDPLFFNCSVIGLDGRVNGWGLDYFSFYRDINSGYDEEFNRQFVENMTKKAIQDKYSTKEK